MNPQLSVIVLIIVLCVGHTLGYLSTIDFHNELSNDTAYTTESHLDFIPDSRLSLVIRQPNSDPAFQPPDSSIEANLVSNNGPMLRSNWEPAHCAEKARTTQAFYQAFLLAQAANEYLDANAKTGSGGSFERYFAGETMVAVRNVFSMLFNPAFRPGSSLLALPNPKFLYMDIRYDAPDRGTSTGQYDNTCKRGSKQEAALIQGKRIAPGQVTDSKRALMVLCPYAFETNNDLPRGPLDSSKDSRCARLRNDEYNTLYLETLASSLLHELFHWDYLTGPATQRRHIADYKAADDPSNTDNDPVNGYGPYNTARISARGRKPFLNADSYVLFANEVYWRKICSKGGVKIRLIDPPNNKKTLVTTPQDADMG